MKNSLKKPEWLRVKLGGGPEFERLREAIHRAGLHTVCEEALCPNRGECWGKGHATLMILGDTCSRSCRFCNVSDRTPEAPDPEEPGKVAAIIRQAGLREVVLTSVTRDDLSDGGAAIWSETIREVRKCPGVSSIEALIPDFSGSEQLLETVFDSAPDILGHNIETVPALYSSARPQADYVRSLDVLRSAVHAGLIAKTAIMVGLGETAQEVLDVMKDAADTGCEILYIGQYLQPSSKHLPVERYVEPGEFDEYRTEGLKMGFEVVVSAPLVRSSYRSDEQSRYVASRLA